jgi:hypothetical protein
VIRKRRAPADVVSHIVDAESCLYAAAVEVKEIAGKTGTTRHTVRGSSTLAVAVFAGVWWADAALTDVTD